MKILKGMVASLLVSSTLLMGLLGFASNAHAAAWYCGYVTPSYLAVYNYPTGSYWHSQLTAYPAYYAANNAFYYANYHCS